MMLGKVDGATMIVMDVFALPVEGTETRVNAQSQAYEYMSTYVNAAKEVRTASTLAPPQDSRCRVTGAGLCWQR